MKTKFIRPILILSLLIFLIFLINCKPNPCDVISVTWFGNLNVDCENGSTNYFGTKYNDYGERISYNFTVVCGNGRSYTGSVTTTYKNHLAVSSSLTVDGKRCN